MPSRVPSVTSPARGLATTEAEAGWRLQPSPAAAAQLQTGSEAALYCTVLYCTVLYCDCDLPVVASPLICNASDK